MNSIVIISSTPGNKLNEIYLLKSFYFTFLFYYFAIQFTEPYSVVW